jgi:hypothetical protein
MVTYSPISKKDGTFGPLSLMESWQKSDPEKSQNAMLELANGF